VSKQSILVAGAGIGGLTAALTLQQRGLDVTVVEQAHDLKPLGVGINLLPPAVRELDELRLADRLSSISVAPSSISYYDSGGSQLFREPRNRRRMRAPSAVGAPRAVADAAARRRPDQLARATNKYRNDTHADRRHA
jgi:2-polyprenyl-6-methoxyphenol hydroxylase-like FAD-dependent oxidoreductase